jgi:hypothetical protein
VGSNRRQDPLVPTEIHSTSVEAVEVAHARLAQELERQRVQVLQNAVVRRPRQRRVEGCVLLNELIVALHRRPLPPEHCVQLLDRFGRRSQRRIAGDPRLEQLAHLQHFAELTLATQDGRRERRNKQLRLGAANEGAAALTALDHALHLQGTQRLTH